MQTPIRFLQTVRNRALPPAGNAVMTFGSAALTFGGVALTFQPA